MFNRFSLLGSIGIVLLQLAACSAESSRQQNSATTDERILNGTTTDITKSGDDPGAGAACDYQGKLDLDKLKWKNTLPRPRVFVPTAKNGNHEEYRVTVRDEMVQMLPDCYPKTQVFAYGGSTIGLDEKEAKDDWSSPGPTFEMTRGTEAHVTWVNAIKIPHLFPIDPTLHWANPKGLPAPTGPFEDGRQPDEEVQKPVPIVTHVHGLEVASDFDGGPDAWFTPTSKPAGVTYDYPNSQPATTLWYHDHTLGITRLNVYAGLAGMYLIRDPNDPIENPTSGVSALPDRKHEMPLVIQNRSFKDDGSLDYPAFASQDHPYWISGSGGNVMVVNGKVWPKMDVERTRYRFRVLNGSNNATFTLSIPGLPVREKSPITVIGSDGGYLAAPVGTDSFKLEPAERADIIVDFSLLSPGQTVTLKNGGDDVVQFVALGAEPVVPTCSLQVQEPPDPAKPAACFSKLNTIPDLKPTDPDNQRTVTLVDAPDGGYLLNGRRFHSEVDEQPKVGTTEDWEIVNISSDAHPIHLHLVQFRILGHQEIDTARYVKDWSDANGGGTVPLAKPAKNPAAAAYLIPDTNKAPEPENAGWKDTVSAPPGFVTRIRVRWAPQDGGAFPFDATQGAGYVWHCHMLEHEDNEMMRPLVLTK